MAPLLVLGAVSTLAMGCGGERSTGDAFATTPPSTPAPSRAPAVSPKSPAWIADRGSPKVGRYATLTPLMHTRGFVRIAASRDLLAVAFGDRSGLVLQVGEPTISGPLALRAARGAGRIPWWAPIHVGTDARGASVVTYPRCRGPRYVTCRAVAWSPSTERERPVAGLAQVRGVVEVAGNAAYVAYRSRAGGAADDPDRAPDFRLMLRPAGSSIRELPGKTPQALELHGGTLAVIRDDSTGREETDAGICGMQAVDLWNLASPGAGPRTIDRMVCGLGGQYFTGVRLDRTKARIMMAANAEDDHAALRTYSPSTEHLTKRRMPGDVPEIVWLDELHGLSIGSWDTCDARVDPTDPSAEPGDCPVSRITLREP